MQYAALNQLHTVNHYGHYGQLKPMNNNLIVLIFYLNTQNNHDYYYCSVYLDRLLSRSNLQLSFY